MPRTKIGRKTQMRQKDVGHYFVFGIAMTLEGFEVRRFKMYCDESIAMVVLHKAESKADALKKFHMETMKHSAEFNLTQIERKREHK